MLPPLGTRVPLRRCSVLLGLCLALAVVQAMADEPVTWTNAVGVSVSGNSLTKTGGNTAWDAGAASLQTIRDGYGYVEFVATETNKHRIVSLSTGDSNQSDTDVDFGIILLSNGGVGVMEGGSYSGQFSTYVTGDRFRVEVRYGVVRCKKNGTVFHISTNRPKFPLRVDAALREPGGTISNVRIGNTVWANEVGVSTTGSSLTKTGATGWTSGAASATALEAADGSMEFVATETNTTRVAGLGAGDLDQTVGDIEYGIQLRDDGIVEIVESGTSRGTFGSYSAGDRFRVEVQNGAIEYFRNGISLYTSTVTAVYPLRVDTALYTAGATLTDLVLEPLIWVNETGVTVSGNSLTKTAGDGWNAGASATRQVASGDAFVEFTALETNTRRAVGLKSGTGAASSYADIDFAIDLSAAGVVEVFELGTSRGQFGTYAHGDRLRVEIHEGSVRYLRNGSAFLTSTTAPTYPLHGEATLYTSAATVGDVHMGDLVWTNSVGLETSATTIRKSGTTTAWDSGLVSTRAINSGYVEIVASETNTHRAIGLSHGNRTAIDTDIDYALLMAPSGTLYIFESGTLRHSNTYTTGDRLRVGIDGSTIKYYRNGTMIYPSTVAPTFPLRVDSSFHNTNATILGVVLVGAAVTDTLEAPTFTPPAGTYTAAPSVTMVSFPGATIRFTTDGTEPTETSTAYTAPVVVNQSLTLKAKAWKTGFDPSSVATAAYTLKVADPGVSPGGSSYTTEQTVTITCSVSGADIHYTTNGVDPTQADTVIASGGTLPISVSSTLKVRAWKAGWTPSNVVSNAYTLVVATPILSPVGGSFVGALPVNVSTTSPGATLHYRTDGSDPTESDPVIASGAAVTLDRSSTLKVRGWRTGWTASSIGSGTYWIGLGTAVTPVLTPPPGTFSSGQTVSASTSTSGAVIRFTVDGTEPTLKSAIYSSPIAVSQTTDLRAKAFAADMTASSTAGGLYVINTGATDTPRLSPGSGTYTVRQTVTVTRETAGAAIHYTLNGLTPTTADPSVVSGGTVTVDRTMVLKAKAFKSGLADSGVGRGEYVVTGAISSGEHQGYALKWDGSVWGFGRNTYGQLGTGVPLSTDQLTPIQIAGLSDIVGISGGAYHLLVVKRDGTAWALGRNDAGQLGNNSTTSSSTPVQCSGLTNVVAVAGGVSHSLAIKADGSLWEWGNDGIGASLLVPTQVAGIRGVTFIAAMRHSMAIKTDGVGSSGQLWTWGTNDQGQLGDATATFRATPVAAAGLSDAVAVEGGNNHTLVVRADGNVWSTGHNGQAQLGTGDFNQSWVPVQTVGANRAVAVAGGTFHSLAQQIDGPLWVFGRSQEGQLGLGNSSPQQPWPVFGLLTRARAIAADASHSIALLTDGTVFGFGSNGNGQLGDGSTTARVSPVSASGLTLTQTDLMGLDSDQDGLTNAEEDLYGTDPGNPDTNGDGIPDGVAVRSGISATALDVDGDGLANALELTKNTDPFRTDTDGDGTSDNTDCFPTDPTRWQCPAPTPGDQTPPVINLTEPTNAILISSIPPA